MRKFVVRQGGRFAPGRRFAPCYSMCQNEWLEDDKFKTGVANDRTQSQRQVLLTGIVRS